MAKKIVWTKRADFKFNRIIKFLEEEWGTNVASAFVEKTYEIITLLSEHPNMGSLEKAEPEVRGFLITKHNRLFYRIVDKELILLNFFYARSGKGRKKY